MFRLPWSAPATPATPAATAPRLADARDLGPEELGSDRSNRARQAGEPIDGTAEDEVVTLESGLFEEGRRCARRSGRTEMDTSQEESLREMAISAAARLAASAYDPATAADGATEARFQANLRRREALRQREDYALAAHRDRVQEWKALGDPPERPGFPWLVGLFGMAGVSLSVTVTLYDQFFVSMFAEKSDAAAAAFLGGALIAGLFVWGILGSVSQPRASGRMWLVSGLVFGLALLGVRWAGVEVAGEAGGEVWTAVGLALLEIASVLVLETFAGGLRNAWEEYRREHRVWTAAEGQVEAASAERDAVTADLVRIDGHTLAHEKDLRRRAHRVAAAPRVERAACDAVVAGYRYGVEQNRGHVLGAAWVPPTARQVLERGELPEAK